MAGGERGIRGIRGFRGFRGVPGRAGQPLSDPVSQPGTERTEVRHTALVPAIEHIGLWFTKFLSKKNTTDAVIDQLYCIRLTLPHRWVLDNHQLVRLVISCIIIGTCHGETFLCASCVLSVS